MTERWQVDSAAMMDAHGHLTQAAQLHLKPAADLLKAGGLVAFPTETVYGLGANAWMEEAALRVFRAKGRPADNPLIVHISDVSELDGVVDREEALPRVVERAMEAFWPGPLTLLLPAHSRIAPAVRPGLTTIGVRMPSHPVARALIRLAGCPIAAPSANVSGRPSPTTAADVLADMDGVIDGVVDGGNAQVGLESTVARITSDEVVIYRPGAITPKDFDKALGIPVRYDEHLKNPSTAPLSPGMKYRHYAPESALVHAWWGDVDHVRTAMAGFLASNEDAPSAIIAPAWPKDLPQPTWLWTPKPNDGDSYEIELGRVLYTLLREYDNAGAAHILIHGVSPEGFGTAVMNRVEKASAGRLYHV